jgi:metal-responsive CopG/Arc/MetJ family transcriptional regulator
MKKSDEIPRKRISFYATQEMMNELDLICKEECGEDRSVIIRRALNTLIKKSRAKRQALEAIHLLQAD